MQSFNDWLVQVPLSQLLELKNSFEQQERIQQENAQLRREIEGLRRVQSETLIVLADLRKSVSGV